MGQEYSLKLFYNTGFNRFNRPDSINILNNATMKTFAAPYLRQDKFIQEIRIAASFSEVEGADYALVGTTAFFINSIHEIAQGTCLINMEVDFIATVGVENINVISGWVKRRHVSSDPLFTNDINEPFQPREHLQIDTGVEVGFTEENETIIASTISLRDSDLDAAKTYVDNAQNLTVTVPDVQPVPYETVCSIPSLEEGVTRNYRLPMTMLYRNLYGVSTVDIKKAVGYLRALGLENSITASYLIPTDAFTGTTGELPYINELQTMIGQSKNADSGLDFVFGSYKNNKVYMGQYTHYTIASIASGNTADFAPEDIYNNDKSVNVILYADPSPTGKPFCRPQYFRKDSTSLWMSSVSGCQWLNAPIRFAEDQISGYAKQMKQTTYANEQIRANLEIAEFQAGMGILSGSVASSQSTAQGLITNPGFTAAGAGLDIVSKFATRDINREQATRAIDRNVQVTIDLARPEIIFPMSDNMAAYYGHKFIVYRTRMTNRDMQRFDKFLTMYGYAVDEPFTKDALTCREKFNYITLTDAQLSIPGYGVSFREGVEAVLAGGVRIWHKLPAAEDFNDNPIVEVDS